MNTPFAATDRQFYYPNKMGRIILLAMEEVMGRNGVNAILNLARLKTLVNSYPPNNFDRQFSFDEVGSIQQAGELCLDRVKPEETLVEARSGSDVQIDRQI